MYTLPLVCSVNYTSACDHSLCYDCLGSTWKSKGRVSGQCAPTEMRERSRCCDAGQARVDPINPSPSLPSAWTRGPTSASSPLVAQHHEDSSVTLSRTFRLDRWTLTEHVVTRISDPASSELGDPNSDPTCPSSINSQHTSSPAYTRPRSDSRDDKSQPELADWRLAELQVPGGGVCLAEGDPARWGWKLRVDQVSSTVRVGWTDSRRLAVLTDRLGRS